LDRADSRRLGNYPTGKMVTPLMEAEYMVFMSLDITDFQPGSPATEAVRARSDCRCQDVKYRAISGSRICA
jgi:hypothetical protein